MVQFYGFIIYRLWGICQRYRLSERRFGNELMFVVFLIFLAVLVTYCHAACVSAPECGTSTTCA